MFWKGQESAISLKKASPRYAERTEEDPGERAVLIAWSAFPRWTPVDSYCSLHISPSGTVTGTGQERVAVVSIQGQSLEGFWLHVILSWRQCWFCFPQCQVSRSYLCPFVPMLGKEGGEESCAGSMKVTQLLVSVPALLLLLLTVESDATFEVCRSPWPREEARNNGMPQITHCPVFDCHNLTVWAEHRDDCMEQKDPAGSTVSLPGLFIVLNDLCVMGFGVRLWENYFSSGSLNFSQPSHRYGKNDAHIHKVVLRTKWQWIKKITVQWMEYSHGSKGQL